MAAWSQHPASSNSVSRPQTGFQSVMTPILCWAMQHGQAVNLQASWQQLSGCRQHANMDDMGAGITFTSLEA